MTSYMKTHSSLEVVISAKLYEGIGSMDKTQESVFCLVFNIQ